MKAVNDLSADYVRSILSYDPLSGDWRWIKTLSRRASAGKQAGAIRTDGRRAIRIDGRDYLAARLAWLIMTGEWPPFDIDHRDLNKGNDRWLNLRPATRSQNFFNKRLTKRNSSGFKGVSFDSARGQWFGELTANGKRILRGRFATAEEAAAAVSEARARAHGEFARF
jgi:hypothetical protein